MIQWRYISTFLLLVSFANVHGQIQDCWLQGCTVMERIETAANMIIEKQENMRSIMVSGYSAESTFNDVHSNITASFVANIETSENHVISALTDKTQDVIEAFTIKIANTMNKINETIATEVGASEDNVLTSVVNELNVLSESVIATLRAETEASKRNLVTSADNIIAAIAAKIEESEKNMSQKIDEIMAIVSSLSFPPASGYKVEARVKEIKVELDIFSGLMNPVWTVTNTSNHFVDVLTTLSGKQSSPLPSRTGYRGFVVTTLLQDCTTVSQTFGHGSHATTTLEAVLLNSNNGSLGTDVVSIVSATINSLPMPDIGGPQAPLAPASIASFNPKCGTRQACVEPNFNAATWTSTSDNSYNYAVNSPSGTFAQPGRAGGIKFTNITGQNIRGSALLDGLKDLEDSDIGEFPVSDNNCLLSLVIIPNVDFHFYRRDTDGTWSHKPGPRPPTNLDNSGNVINDPRTADISPYKFARFLSLCPRKVNIT